MKQIDPIRPWFDAAEDLGEYIGIRFGRLARGADEPEWFFLPHTDYDGIGGLAHLLRERGAHLPRLAQIKHPAPSSWLSLVAALPKLVRPLRRVKWAPLEGPTQLSTNQNPPAAVAWHVFGEAATMQIKRVCRKKGYTVNSFLLKHLTKAIRPSLADESSFVPWMLPVNLRGKVRRNSDVENHSSYVTVNVQSYETVKDIHANIYSALSRGEHWANWFSYRAGLLLTHGIRKFLIKTERCTSQWNIGGFSNLGDWDSEKKLDHPSCAGPWLFCPPAMCFQKMGAGCVTFQNRLSLTLQAYPALTTNSKVPRGWMQNWVKEIEMDLVSVLSDSVAMPWAAAS